MWTDYIDLLRYFGKDLYNAHYVCPANLKAEHDRLMEKKRKTQATSEREERRMKLLLDQANYEKQKGKYFGIVFSDSKIMVKTLESVEEIMHEGDTLHHCVFTNEYYNKPNSLIMSARIDNAPIETIEVSLKSFEILQARGLQNKSSEYHNQIVSLVRENMNKIRKIALSEKPKKEQKLEDILS